MKKNKLTRKIFLAAALTMIMVLCGASVYADSGQPQSMKLTGTGDTDGVTLYSQEVDEETYFMLPSGVKSENIKADSIENTTYKTTQSANIASVFFVSADPEKKGMDYVHGSEDHSAKAKGMVYMYDENFKLIYSGEVSALKGRGNTTWSGSEKKPYQMKLEKKADLLNPAEPSQKAKTWILLSNPFDPTLIKNSLVYSFAKEIGLENTPEGRAVDMYYDGTYRGSYYLCEKVEIGDNRVEIDDLEEAVEEANPDIDDFDDLETATGVNSLGKEYSYVKGINDPEDITGGYLLEIDNIYYYKEKSWFGLGFGYWTSKSPEYLSENMAKYISEYCQNTFDYIYNERKQYGEGSDVFNYIDKESFTKYLFTMEYFDNNDTWSSSTYVYKPKGEDKLYAGPVWDCDAIMQIKHAEKDPEGWNIHGLGRHLLALPEFREALKETYVNEIRPVMQDTLLGDTDGTYLKTYAHMKENLSASVAMNDLLWDIDNLSGTYFPDATIEENYESFYNLMKQRAKWIDKTIMADDFTENVITVKTVKAPEMTADSKEKSITVKIPVTKYIENNVAAKRTQTASDYQIAYRVKGTQKWKTVKTGGKLEYTLKNLGVRDYQIKVRAVAETATGIKYGKYSAVKAASTKPAVTKVTLSTSSYEYDGKVKQPKVTVKAGTKALLSKKTKGNSNVTVSYGKGRTNVGTYKITVKGKGKYTGKVVKTFKINPVKPSVSKPSAKKNQITVKWNQVKKQADGYQIMYSTSKNFKKGNATETKLVKTAKTTSAKISGLKSGKAYYVKVRTYKEVNGETYYSKWSTVKKVQTK